MSLLNVGEKLFMNSANADVIFVVEDKKVPGHRAILSVICPYFERMFYGGLKESSAKNVVITETPAKVFMEVIRYAYLGQLKIEEWTFDEILSLLCVVHEYQYDELLSEVVIALEKTTLDFDTWQSLYSAAITFDLEKLKQKSFEFAADKITDFSNQLNLDRFSPEFVCCMFDSPKITEEDQDKLLLALNEWRKNNCTSKIMSAFTKIRWENVSPITTANIIKELFMHVDNVNDFQFWTHISTKEELNTEPCENALVSIDELSIVRGSHRVFPCPKYDCSFEISYITQRIKLEWSKYDLFHNVQFKAIDWYLPLSYTVKTVRCFDMENLSFSCKMSKEMCGDWQKHTFDFGPVRSCLIYIDFESNLPAEFVMRRFSIY